MTIIVGPPQGEIGEGVNPAEAFIFKQDFTASDRATAELDRDAYYIANPSELIELDANPNWFITLTFQDLGVSTVVAQVRRSGVWATLGGSSGVDFSNMTDGEVAIYDQATGKLIGRDVFIDEAGSLVVGTNSLSLGQVHTMSSGYENVMFSNDVTGSTFHPTWQNATVGGDETPTARMYTAPMQPKVVIPDNGDDKTGQISSPDYTGSPSVDERLFSIYVEAVASITNVVANLVDVASGERVYRVDLGDLVADVETKVAFNVPIDVKIGVSNRIEIRSDDGIVTLKADVTDTYPWIAFDVQPWEDKPVGLVEDSITSSERQSILNLTPVLNFTNFTASQNGYYYTDTSVVGSVVVTVPNTVTEFIIADPNSTWSNSAYVDVVVGADTVRLKLANRNKYYQFIRFGDTFFVYDGQGKFKTTGSVV